MDFSDPENENAFRAFYICDKRGTILFLEQCRDNETTSVLLLPSASLFFLFFFFVTDSYGLIYSAVSKKSFSTVKSTVAQSIWTFLKTIDKYVCIVYYKKYFEISLAA